MVRLIIGTALFVVTGYVGRATVIDGQGLSLIWPAVGVAGLWVSSGTRRTWPFDAAALSGSILLVTLSTGAGVPIALVFVATNLVQVFTFAGLSQRWLSGTWGFGGAEPLDRIADLGRLVLAASTSGIAGLAVGYLGALAAGRHPTVATLAVWWGRNSVALIVITVLGVLVGQRISAAGGLRASIRDVARRSNLPPIARILESAGLLGVTVVLSVLIFSDSTAHPLAFLLLVMSVWAGIRYSPVVTVVHGTVMGVCGIAFTLADRGPFAAVAELHYRAMVAQGFVAMTVLTGLALAFSRVELAAANESLAEAQRVADDRARLLDAVLETMQEGVVVIEEGGRVLVRNTAGRRLVGLGDTPLDRLQPAATYGLFHSNGLPVTDEELPVNRALAGEVVAPEDLHVRTPALPLGRVIEVSAQPLANDDPSCPQLAMVNIRDVTVDRQHRDALASFAGVIAHDLFNPLTIVDGWTEALADEFRVGPVSPLVGTVMVNRIHGAAEHMRTFIADLMSYTIARDQSLHYGPVDLTTMVRSLAGLRSHAGTEPLIVVGNGLHAWADNGLVRQLLDNLIGNAIKYVAPGVRPTVEITGHVDGDWLEIRVADNGIGIPEDQREAVFESLHRAHGDRFGGTGLGLAICRRIVDRHGGTIHVVPLTRGSGSVFVFRLPRLAPARDIAAA